MGALIGTAVGAIGPALLGPGPSYSAAAQITFPEVGEPEDESDVQQALATLARLLRSDPVLDPADRAAGETVRTEVPQDAFVITVIATASTPERSAQLANQVVADFGLLLERQSAEEYDLALSDLRRVRADLQVDDVGQDGGDARAKDALVAQRAVAIARRDRPALPVVVRRADAVEAAPATSPRGGVVTGFACGALSALGLVMVAAGRKTERSR